MSKVFKTGGDDYYPGPYNVTFPVGVTIVLFNISIYNDNVSETGEEFQLIIDSYSLPSAVTVGIPNTTIVTIKGNCTYKLLLNFYCYHIH